MKRLLVLMLVCSVAYSNMRAQVIMKPSEPNTVCAEAWEKYHKGDVLWKTGWGLFGVGGAMGIAGGVTGFITGFYGSAYPPEMRDPKASIAPLTGYAIMGIGCGLFVASIPCIVVGQVQRKKALEEYNGKCSDQTPLTFSIQSSANGLGLAMQF